MTNRLKWMELWIAKKKQQNIFFFWKRKFIVTSIKGNYHRNFKSSPVHCNFGFFSFVVWNLVNSWNTFCVRLFVCLYIVITSWFIGFFFIGHRSIRYFFFSLYTQPINLQVRAFRSDLAPEQNTRTKAESKKEIENVHFVNCLSLVHNKQNKYCGKKVSIKRWHCRVFLSVQLWKKNTFFAEVEFLCAEEEKKITFSKIYVYKIIVIEADSKRETDANRSIIESKNNA